MNYPRLPFTVNPMTPADILPVIAVEQAAYTSSLPQRDYTYELNHNRLAHYFVLHSHSNALDPTTTIIGVGGFWLVADELHIITLATRPDWQGQGLGEWLLLTLLEQGQSLKLQIATLEVRPSNSFAISLYKKYKFQEVGRRPGYYSNNGEDALILTTPPLHLPDYQAMLAQRKATLLARLAQIKVNKL